MIRRLTFPGEIYCGLGSLEQLRTVPARCALVVADPFLKTLGAVDRVVEFLRGAVSSIAIYDGIAPDPNRAVCDRAAEYAREVQPDLIVALGGGSAIDTAKALWVKYEHPDLTWDQLTTFFTIPPLRQKARLAVIPTTSGTGSEVSYAAMVTNESADPPIKECLLAYTLCPDVVIADPSLTVSVPPTVTAWTGFDVLSHAIEAAVSRFATDITTGLAAQAVHLVHRWLPIAYEDGGNIEARDHLQQASMIAGMAMASAGLGVMHSLAHALGITFHYHHGLACAYAMSQTIAFNSVTKAEAYAGLARTALDIDATTPLESCRRLVGALDDLKARVGIPLSLETAGLNADSFASKRAQLINLAARDGNRPSNPRDYEDEDLARLLDAIWIGHAGWD